MPDVPKIAEWIVRNLAPGREGEAIAADLREEFEARGGGRLWYWKQALSCVAVRLSPHRLVLPGLGQDFHFAFRSLRRNPGYAAAAMLCLALGIGVNTTVYTLTDELFFKKLPVPDAEKVVMLERTSSDMSASYRDFEDLRRRTGNVFSSLTAYDDMPTSLDTEGVSQMIMAQAVTANYAETLRLRPQIGRWFTPEDEAIGAQQVAVLSDHAWARRFGRSPDALGQLVRVETRWLRVIGVAPPGFAGVSLPHAAEIWVCLPAQNYVRQALARPTDRDRPRIRMIGRLAPGVRIEAAEAEIRRVEQQIIQDFPREKEPNGILRLVVASGIGVPAARPIMFHIAALLIVVTSMVLLIACVNVANLLLSRCAVRRREIAVRQALGAGRWRLTQQILTESFTLAAGGCVLGVILGIWTNRLLVQSVPAIPHIGYVQLAMALNWRVVAVSMVTALISAILFSLSPAIEQSRADLTPALKSDGSGLGRMRQRDFYVIAQVALSLVLLIGAVLLLRALGRAGTVDPGFAMDHRLVARIYVSEPEYTRETGYLFFKRALEQVRATPGVLSATVGYTVPMNFMDNTCVAADQTEKPRRGLSNIVEPGYLDVMRIPLTAGRDFTTADRRGLMDAVIVNQTLAKRYWPSQSPIGKTIWLGCDEKRPRDVAEIVGVARDAKYASFDEAPRPFVYKAFAQNWVGFMALTVHTAGPPGQFTGALRDVLKGIDPQLRIYEVSTLEELTAQSLWQTRWQAWMLAVLGLLAIALAAVGLYGVVAYSVAQRTQEIGVRMAMGAQKSDVLWMVLTRGLRLTVVGIAIGLTLSALVTRFLGSLLFGLSPLDPVSFLGASLFWVGTAMLASYLPARRAARVDPVIALRWE